MNFARALALATAILCLGSLDIAAQTRANLGSYNFAGGSRDTANLRVDVEQSFTTVRIKVNGTSITVLEVKITSADGATQRIYAGRTSVAPGQSASFDLPRPLRLRNVEVVFESAAVAAAVPGQASIDVEGLVGFTTRSPPRAPTGPAPDMGFGNPTTPPPGVSGDPTVPPPGPR